MFSFDHSHEEGKQQVNKHPASLTYEIPWHIHRAQQESAVFETTVTPPASLVDGTWAGGSPIKSALSTGSSAPTKEIPSSSNFSAFFPRPANTKKAESVKPDHNYQSQTLSKDYWMSDSLSVACYECESAFTVVRRRHHCRSCGQVFCASCTTFSPKAWFGATTRLCHHCYKIHLQSRRKSKRNPGQQAVSSTTAETTAGLRPVGVSSSAAPVGPPESDSFSHSNDEDDIDGDSDDNRGAVSVDGGDSDHQGRVPDVDSPSTSSLPGIVGPGATSSLSTSGLPTLSAASKDVVPVQSLPGGSFLGSLLKRTAWRKSNAPVAVDDHHDAALAAATAVAAASTLVNPALMSPSMSVSAGGIDSSATLPLTPPAAAAAAAPIDDDELDNSTPTSFYAVQRAPRRRPSMFPLDSESRDEIVRELRLSELEHVDGDDNADDGGGLGPLYRKRSDLGTAKTTRSSGASLAETAAAAALLAMDPRTAFVSIATDSIFSLVKHLCSLHQIRPIWINLCINLVTRACRLVDPPVRIGGPMDIVNYVKVKKLCTRTATSSRAIDGLVFTQQVAHRRMRGRIINPRLLLFGCPLEFERRAQQRLSALDNLLTQESQHLTHLVGRIVACRPDVVMCEQRVARHVQELLLDKGVTLLQGVKRRVLQRVAFCTGARILPSADADQIVEDALGTAQLFYVKSYHQDLDDTDDTVNASELHESKETDPDGVTGNEQFLQSTTNATVSDDNDSAFLPIDGNIPSTITSGSTADQPFASSPLLSASAQLRIQSATSAWAFADTPLWVKLKQDLDQNVNRGKRSTTRFVQGKELHAWPGSLLAQSKSPDTSCKQPKTVPSTSSVSSSTGRRTLSLCVIEGCSVPKHGCTIELFGETKPVLDRVKAVIQIALYCVYYLDLETHLLSDLQATVDVSPDLSSHIEEMARERLQGFEKQVVHDGDRHLLLSASSSLNNLNSHTSSSLLDNDQWLDLLPYNPVVCACLKVSGLGIGARSFLTLLRSPLDVYSLSPQQQTVEETRTSTSMSIAPRSVSYDLPPVFIRLFRILRKQARAGSGRMPDLLASNSPDNLRTPDNPRALHPSGALFDYCTVFDMPDGRNGPALPKVAPAIVVDNVANPHPAALLAGGALPAERVDVSRSLVYQHTLFCTPAGTQCVPYELHCIEFESPTDLCLGQFLERFCFDFNARCCIKSFMPGSQANAEGSAHGGGGESCSVPLPLHERSFLHNDQRLSVRVSEIQTPIDLAQQHAGRIRTWSICKVCGTRGSPRLLSHAAWKYSFGRYLQSAFYGSQSVVCHEHACSHSVHRDHVRFFSFCLPMSSGSGDKNSSSTVPIVDGFTAHKAPPSGSATAAVSNAGKRKGKLLSDKDKKDHRVSEYIAEFEVTTLPVMDVALPPVSLAPVPLFVKRAADQCMDSVDVLGGRLCEALAADVDRYRAIAVALIEQSQVARQYIERATNDDEQRKQQEGDGEEQLTPRPRSESAGGTDVVADDKAAGRKNDQPSLPQSSLSLSQSPSPSPSPVQSPGLQQRVRSLSSSFSYSGGGAGAGGAKLPGLRPHHRRSLSTQGTNDQPVVVQDRHSLVAADNSHLESATALPTSKKQHRKSVGDWPHSSHVLSLSLDNVSEAPDTHDDLPPQLPTTAATDRQLVVPRISKDPSKKQISFLAGGDRGSVAHQSLSTAQSLIKETDVISELIQDLTTRAQIEKDRWNQALLAAKHKNKQNKGKGGVLESHALRRQLYDAAQRWDVRVNEVVSRVQRCLKRIRSVNKEINKETSKKQNIRASSVIGIRDKEKDVKEVTNKDRVHYPLTKLQFPQASSTTAASATRIAANHGDVPVTNSNNRLSDQSAAGKATPLMIEVSAPTNGSGQDIGSVGMESSILPKPAASVEKARSQSAHESVTSASMELSKGDHREKDVRQQPTAATSNQLFKDEGTMRESVTTLLTGDFIGTDVGADGTVVVVRHGDPGSTIAHALASATYQREMATYLSSTGLSGDGDVAARGPQNNGPDGVKQQPLSFGSAIDGALKHRQVLTQVCLSARRVDLKVQHPLSKNSRASGEEDYSVSVQIHSVTHLISAATAVVFWSWKKGSSQHGTLMRAVVSESGDVAWDQSAAAVLYLSVPVQSLSDGSVGITDEKPLQLTLKLADKRRNADIGSVEVNVNQLVVDQARDGSSSETKPHLLNLNLVTGSSKNPKKLGTVALTLKVYRGPVKDIMHVLDDDDNDDDDDLSGIDIVSGNGGSPAGNTDETGSAAGGEGTEGTKQQRSKSVSAGSDRKRRLSKRKIRPMSSATAAAIAASATEAAVPSAASASGPSSLLSLVDTSSLIRSEEDIVTPADARALEKNVLEEHETVAITDDERRLEPEANDEDREVVDGKEKDDDCREEKENIHGAADSSCVTSELPPKELNEALTQLQEKDRELTELKRQLRERALEDDRAFLVDQLIVHSDPLYSESGLSVTAYLLFRLFVHERVFHSPAHRLLEQVHEALRQSLDRNRHQRDLLVFWLHTVSSLHEMLKRELQLVGSMAVCRESFLVQLQDLQTACVSMCVNLLVAELENHGVDQAWLHGDLNTVGDGGTAAKNEVKSLCSDWQRLLGDRHPLFTSMGVKIVELAMHRACHLVFQRLLQEPTVCTCSTGLQIKMNISEFDECFRKKPGENGAGLFFFKDQLALLRQAADVLNTDKRSLVDEEVRANVCPLVSLVDLHRLLANYTPDMYDPERVHPGVLQELKKVIATKDSDSNDAGSLDGAVIIDGEKIVSLELGLSATGLTNVSVTDIPEAVLGRPMFNFLK